MFIVLVLLMSVLLLAITHLRGHEERQVSQVSLPAPRLQTKVELGFEIPVNYCFHPVQTWAATREGRDSARIGIDIFTAAVRVLAGISLLTGMLAAQERLIAAGVRSQFNIQAQTACETEMLRDMGARSFLGQGLRGAGRRRTSVWSGNCAYLVQRSLLTMRRCGIPRNVRVHPGPSGRIFDMIDR